VTHVTQVAVLSGDARLEEALRTAGLRASRIDMPDLAEYARASRAPAVVVVDIRGQNQVPAALAAFRKQHAGSGVVLVVSTLDPRLMLDAMRAGVTECLHEPLTPRALEEAVRRVLVDRIPETSGQIVAFVGSKGGVGATTLAVNTATTLARAGGEVLVIDLHVGHGDAGLFLGVEPRFSVVDALENLHRVDDAFFKGLVEKTKAGVDLLGPSDRLIQGGVDAARLRTLLEFAAHKYRFTVLDIPRSDVTMLDVLEAASAIAIVATQELPALRHAGRLAHALRTRYSGARVTAVVNRFDRQAEIGHDDVERVIGTPVKHLIPSDYRAAIDALNAGRPVVLEQGKLAQALRALAGDFGGAVKEATERPAGVLGRLAFRRA
jgi:pilus assembly protein CpaE